MKNETIKIGAIKHPAFKDYWLPFLEVIFKSEQAGTMKKRFYGDKSCASLTKKDALKHAEWAKNESLNFGTIIQF